MPAHPEPCDDREVTCRIALCLSLSKKIAPIQARWDWPAAQLAHALGLSGEALRARIMFWINQGVIAEARTAAGLVSHPSVIIPSTSICTRCPFLKEEESSWSGCLEHGLDRMLEVC